MSIPAADVRKIINIVRQYEVIYGGGISSSDAAVREECENIVGVLETELGLRGSSSPKSIRTAKSMPSLVDIKKMPRRASEPKPRPSTARASEMARLGMPKAEPAPAKVKASSAKAVSAKTSASAVSGKPGAKKAAAKAAAPKASAKRAAAAGDDLKSSSAETARVDSAKPKDELKKEQKAAKASKAMPPRPGELPAWAKDEDDEVLKDVRSRHVLAVKAARERDAKITGAADTSSETETKRRFAAQHLFEAFTQNKLPKYGGFIVTIRFDENTGYSVIEIIGYENLQDIYPEGETLVFKSVGCKLYAIVEPTNYYLKSVEPVNRPSEQMIPYRFSELLRITTKRFQTILIGRKPVFMPTSFSVFKPAGEDLAVLFYDIADVYANIQDFIIMILRDRLGVPIPDSRKAGEVIARGIHEFKLWLDEA